MKVIDLQEAKYYKQEVSAEDAAETIIRYLAQELDAAGEELYFALMNDAKRRYQLHALFDESLIDSIIEKIAYG